jgi:hypothetical protein
MFYSSISGKVQEKRTVMKINNEISGSKNGIELLRPAKRLIGFCSIDSVRIQLQCVAWLKATVQKWATEKTLLFGKAIPIQREGKRL